MSRATLYWILQFSGWGIYSVFLISMIIIFAGPDYVSKDTFIIQLVFLVTLITSSHLLRLVIKKQNWLKFSIRKIVFRSLIGSAVTSFSAQAIIHFMIYLVLPIVNLDDFSIQNFMGYVLSVFLVMSLWTAIYLSIQFLRRNQQNEIEKLELNHALSEAELTVLKNQINPHFLFNALNNIRSLVLIDPEKARTMITHISDLLRYSIQFNAREKTPLEEEIEIVKDYLALEEIQFGDRLNYSIQIDESTKQVQLPPMTIQLLVENAIKHGIAKQKNGGEILITSSNKENQTVIEVKNSGTLNKEESDSGIGIKNLTERMNIMFGPSASFILKNSTENSVIATITLPYDESINH